MCWKQKQHFNAARKTHRNSSIKESKANKVKNDKDLHKVWFVASLLGAFSAIKDGTDHFQKLKSREKLCTSPTPLPHLWARRQFSGEGVCVCVCVCVCLYFEPPQRQEFSPPLPYFVRPPPPEGVSRGGVGVHKIWSPTRTRILT